MCVCVWRRGGGGGRREGGGEGGRGRGRGGGGGGEGGGGGGEGGGGRREKGVVEVGGGWSTNRDRKVATGEGRHRFLGSSSR